MERRAKQEHICGYGLYYTRHSSYVVWNDFGNDRRAIHSALEEYFTTIPSDFEPRRLIYSVPQTPSKLSGLLFAADDPEDFPKNIIVLAVQPQIVSDDGHPGIRQNCHWTTELYPADTCRLIPASYEFALGAVPSKRLNFVVQDNNEWRPLDQSGQHVTGFRHFLSAAYSKHGVSLIDFVFTIKNDRTQSRETSPSGTGDGRLEFLASLKADIAQPLERLQTILSEDRGVFSPPDLIDLPGFFGELSNQAAETVYANLTLYDRERSSNIIPHARAQTYRGGLIVPPPKLSPIAKSIETLDESALKSPTQNPVIIIE